MTAFAWFVISIDFIIGMALIYLEKDMDMAETADRDIEEDASRHALHLILGILAMNMFAIWSMMPK